ncbi:TPA: hypothetical protein I7272_10950 [Vibrio parahaemolyticus]|nr:hypothetical protein [Vibrio parahaemolyticus]HAS6693590.1 hypothetical protein [Vibrio parahaemolyticus]
MAFYVDIAKPKTGQCKVKITLNRRNIDGCLTVSLDERKTSRGSLVKNSALKSLGYHK